MPTPLRIVLNEESDRTLQELRVASRVAQQIKDRAHMVRLNAQGWNVPAIAEIFECQEQTVRETLRRWKNGGKTGDYGIFLDGGRNGGGVRQTCSI